MDGNEKETKMLKVAVFDTGWGGDLVAEYLDENVGVIEVRSVIDWRHAEQYLHSSRHQICRMVETALQEQIGKADVIVLASFMAQCAYNYLRRHYPFQKFVQMDWPRLNYQRLRGHKIMVLACDQTRRSAKYRHWKQNLKRVKVVEPPCDHWLEWIDEGTFSRQRLRRELWPYRLEKIDTVVLANTHLWDLQEQIEYALGWQVRAVDTRVRLLRKVCLALQLEGAYYIGRF